MSTNIDLLDIATPLGEQPFRLVRVSGAAALSKCFRYALTLRAGLSKLAVDDLLDKPVTVTIAGQSEGPCYINGIVSEITQIPADSVGSNLLGAQSFWDYQLIIVPSLWFLRQTSDCRIFQNQTAQDIVTAILAEAGISDYEFIVTGTLPKRVYTVMYNESYLAFVERVLAEEGLFWFFVHDKEKHSLIIGNDSKAFQPLLASPILFTGKSAEANGIDRWSQADATAVGEVLRRDYNPETASTAVKADSPTMLGASGASKRVHYRWPAQVPTTGEAQALSKRHMEAHEAPAKLFEGHATIADFYPGAKFTFDGDPTGGSDYVVAGTAIVISDDSGNTSRQQGSGIEMSLTAFPSTIQWKPHPMQKPALPGMHSAVVVGPSGEEIYTDDLGRIKVQFSWDRRGETDEKSSCWLRVVQPWAGNGWGAQFIPRVGQEVAVTFLEGDIDRPVAIGALYNSTNKPIFAPADKNKSGFRSRSTKGGGTADYNEFSFDDTKGSEIVLLHAQKDHKIEVENDQTMDVGHNRTVTVKKDETITVDGNQTETVKGNRSFEVDGKHAEQVKGTQSITVTQAVTYESMESITLKVGGNSIKIDQTGITLSGTMIKVSAEAQLQTTGAIAQHNASGMMTLQAGIIQVN